MNNIKDINSIKSWLFWASFFLLAAKAISYWLYPKDFLNLDFLNSKILAWPLFLITFWFINSSKKKQVIPAFLAFLLFFIDNCDSFYRSGFLPHQFIEHTLMMFTPLLAVYYDADNDKKSIFFVALATALTFIGHGVFAVSWNAIPPHFEAMTKYILGLEGVQVKIFLLCMGILDFVAAFFLFLKPLRKTAIIYMIIWGVLTSFARFIYGFNDDIIHGALGTFYRFPHFIAPLTLYIYFFSKSESHSSSLP